MAEPGRSLARQTVPAVDPARLAELQDWLGAVPPARDQLIEALHTVQDRLGCLPRPHLAALAAWMKRAPVEVYEVASFYHHFHIVDEVPPQRLPWTLRVCDSLPCALAGAADLHRQLQAQLGDAVRVVPTPCVGLCDQAPVAVLHQHALAPASVESVRAALAAGDFTAPLPPQALDLQAYRAAGGYRLLQDCRQGLVEPLAVIESLERAGLRGLGGAGFPVARKWRLVRAQPAPRLLVVNADEGEPGTFKDRVCLEEDPHRFLEGVLLAAWAVEAQRVFIYLRDEYPGVRALLQRELEALGASGAIEGLPSVVLRRGAGAYVCGEESAMLESIEGRRGLPRQRPPYVAEHGLFGRPTLVHNVETLFWLREIVETGGQAYAAQGRQGRSGLRRYSVSGRVCSPGVKLAPAGISLRDLVDEHCGGMLPGHALQAYLPGGASGGILPAHLADLPLDFDTLQAHDCFIGSAAIIVLSQFDCVQDAARNVMAFFAHESCGQCTPCRSGAARAVQLMAQPRWDPVLLRDLSQVMRDASICGLGQAAPNVMEGVLRHFPLQPPLTPDA